MVGVHDSFGAGGSGMPILDENVKSNTEKFQDDLMSLVKDDKKTWYVGEGLKQGDFFSYSMCHVDYKECSPFVMDVWIKGDKQVGSETRWLAEVVVSDGDKRIVGEMELGKIVPEPTGGSEELGVYRGTFKSSVIWLLSAFATSGDSSGGKRPINLDVGLFHPKIDGPAFNVSSSELVEISKKIFNPYIIELKDNHYHVQFWIADNFPFPIKAESVIEAKKEFQFELLDYRENVIDPFSPVTLSENEKITVINKPNDEHVWYLDKYGYAKSSSLIHNGKKLAISTEFIPHMMSEELGEGSLKFRLFDVDTNQTIKNMTFRLEILRDNTNFGPGHHSVGRLMSFEPDGELD